MWTIVVGVFLCPPHIKYAEKSWFQMFSSLFCLVTESVNTKCEKVLLKSIGPLETRETSMMECFRKNSLKVVKYSRENILSI